MNMKKTAFSLVEMLVVLVVMSIIMAALTPVITKRMKSNSVSVSGGNNTFLADCPEWEDCVFCTRTQCSLCQKSCGIDEYANTPDCSCKKCNELVSNCYSCSQKKCTKCYGGYGISNDKMAFTKCSAGNYSDGSSACKAASTGHYVANDGASSQTPCEIGKYQSNTGQTSCTTCAEGKYTANTGNSSCSTCEEDYMCSSGIRTQCAKNQGAISGSSSCSACPANCIDCKVPDTCIECSSAYYISGGQCVQCSAGYSCNGKTRTQCTADTAAALGAGVCSACTGATGANAGSASCSACPNNCTDCTIPSTCLTCTNNYVISNGSCSSCLGSNCTACNSSGCTACNANYVVKDGACVSAGIAYTCSVSGMCSETKLGDYKYIKILKSGTFTVTSAPSEDATIFVVGGGGAGGMFEHPNSHAGGNGGGIKEESFKLQVANYVVTIGTGGTSNCGSGSASTFALDNNTKVTANGGAGCSATTGVMGTIFNGTYYGCSGSPGVMWGQSSASTCNGGGRGGSYDDGGASGTNNTGGGGGGGGTGCWDWNNDDDDCPGGNGGSGIIIIKSP